ncbi:AraC family transcriptional regulator [Proteiniphilum sp.]|uniref:AraC family transcriptional regulator n=1 Tax=Proteiniphilum sp. TaxID=1926877 RepID=UPI002B1E9A49|nr:AraC family transcriptional regulator [Proteiniphilum sp.]MEA4916626.1 AraC family transcriptional regulator [Proteiniphilum sp.]
MENDSKNIKYCHMPDEAETSFTFDYVRIVWNEHLSLHQQKTWELAHVMIGKGTRIIGDTIEPFAQGEVILIPPDIPHSWSYSKSLSNGQGEIENITIVFSDLLLDNLVITFPELSTVISAIQKKKDAVSFSGDALKQLQTLMISMIRETKIEQIASLIRLLVLIASAEDTDIVGHPVVEDKHNKRLQQVYWYVMNHFQQDVILDEVSRFVNMEKSSFCAFFKKMTGKTFFGYLTEYRIDSSCQMLLKTEKSISEICFASGFRDVPYYNRVFKKLKKITPTDYRAQFS